PDIPGIDELADLALEDRWEIAVASAIEARAERSQDSCDAGLQAVGLAPHHRRRLGVILEVGRGHPVSPYRSLVGRAPVSKTGATYPGRDWTGGVAAVAGGRVSSGSWVATAHA